MATTQIILVNWNGRDHTIECLESLMRLDSGDFDVVIVDNGSADGSIAAIEDWALAPESAHWKSGPPWPLLPAERAHLPGVRVIDRAALGDASPDGTRITIIAANANLGFAGATNLGLAFGARDRDARYFWLLNNDTVVAPDSLTLLVEKAAARPDAGIIGATLLYYHQPDMVQGLGGLMDVKRALASHIGLGLSADALPDEAAVEAQMTYVMGASMFVRRSVYDATGGMSEDYFLYFEEPDWAQRLPRGVHQAVCLAAKVYHKEGGTIGSNSLTRASDTSLYYLIVNSLRFYARYHRASLPLMAARMAKYGFDYGRKGDRQARAVIARAFVDALTGRRRKGPYGSALFRAGKGKAA
ncbi:glycosyltransferase family 2 protein [Sphingobium sp. H39-3-25]|uniref:glycosyltransferase family 2 protein n=1 Tax=Sphingobium arseniciresistens TaxID=3030834 RepID=UPI0023B9566F|nr:glycosyltransferase family 2 protein [Sphingobium arseniciresistens]